MSWVAENRTSVTSEVHFLNDNTADGWVPYSKGDFELSTSQPLPQLGRNPTGDLVLLQEAQARYPHMITGTEQRLRMSSTERACRVVIRLGHHDFRADFFPRCCRRGFPRSTKSPTPASRHLARPLPHRQSRRLPVPCALKKVQAGSYMNLPRTTTWSNSSSSPASHSCSASTVKAATMSAHPPYLPPQGGQGERQCRAGRYDG